MSSEQIRDATTVIVIRDGATTPRLLMGQRGSKAAFMPNKYVFPGGAVDPSDNEMALVDQLPEVCSERLGNGARRYALAAIRELWEETGLILGTQAQTPDNVPPDWQSFCATGHLPSAAALRYMFRAITPPGRTRRFDARFFLVDATAIRGDLDDFTGASDELSHLHWVALEEARDLNLPFITEVVLAEVKALVGQESSPPSVPFFDNSGTQSRFIRLQ